MSLVYQHKACGLLVQLKRYYCGVVIAAVATLGWCSATAPAVHAQLTVQSNPALSSPMPPPQPNGAPAPELLPAVTLDLDTTHANTDTPLRYGLGRVIVEGDPYTRDFVINNAIEDVLDAAFLPANGVDEAPLLNTQALESALNRVNQHKHFRLQAKVSKAQTSPGNADIRFSVTEPQPWQITTAVDNQGRPGVGLYRSHVQVTNSNLLGIGDSLLARYTVAARTHRAMATYDMPINSHGGRFNVSYRLQHHNYKPELTNTGNALVGRDHVWFVTLEQPLGKKRQWTPFVSTLFRRLSFNNRNVGIVNGDSWIAGLKWRKKDRYGSTFVNAKTTWSNQFFGGNAKFWKAQAYGKRTVNLPHRQQLVFRGNVLLSPDPMPPALQMSLGGAYTVRGFSEGLFNADRGYFVSGEYYFPIPGLKQVAPRLHPRVRGVAFVDAGQAWVDKSGRNFVPGVSNTSGNSFLYSAGLGVRANVSRFAQCFCDVAVANLGMSSRRGAELLGAPTVRAHFGIRSDWLPKRQKRIKAAPNRPVIWKR